MSNIPFVGKKYKVISGHYTGFIGECVSYDLESPLPVILQDEEYNGCAVTINEIEVIENESIKQDISHLQKN